MTIVRKFEEEIINLCYILSRYISTSQKFCDLILVTIDWEVCGSFHSSSPPWKRIPLPWKARWTTAQAPCTRTREPHSRVNLFSNSRRSWSVAWLPRAYSRDRESLLRDDKSGEMIIILQVTDGSDCEIIAQHRWSNEERVPCAYMCEIKFSWLNDMVSSPIFKCHLCKYN